MMHGQASIKIILYIFECLLVIIISLFFFFFFWSVIGSSNLPVLRSCLLYLKSIVTFYVADIGSFTSRCSTTLVAIIQDYS